MSHNADDGGGKHTHTHRTTEETGFSFPRHNQLNIIFFEEEITHSYNVVWLQVFGE